MWHARIAALMGMVLAVGMAGIGAAEPPAAAKKPAKAELPAVLEEPVSQLEAKVGPPMSVEGEIAMRQEDVAGGLTYLRIRDAEGRIWLMEVNASTSVAGGTGKVGSKDLLEGVRVQATFPRGGNDTPVASSVTILVP